MAYTDVFGGELLFPSQLSYNSITTAVDVTLQWPREQQIEGTNVVADWMDVDTTVASLNIDMPAATNTSTGNKTTFNNVGSNTFTVRDSTGGTIQSVAPGEQWVLILRDNTTAAGLWRTSQLGATVASASASALAGAGIKAITTTLNQMIDSDVEGSTPFTVVDGDRAKCLIYTAGAGTCNLPSPGTVGNDWWFMLRNSGSGTLNVLPPSGQIDGSASINMDTNDSAIIFTDGTDFFTVGFGQGNTLAFDYVSLAVPGSGDFVLSGANLDRIAYNFTGALTGNRRIVVPNTVQQYWIDNQTSGAFTLEIDTAAGAGQIIPQGESAIVYCDATDVINAVSSTSVTFPITIGQGGTGATTVGGAQTNLQVPPDSRLINTNANSGLAGGGDLSGDRSLSLDVDNLTTENTLDGANDEMAFYDDDAAATRKTIMRTLGLPLPLAATAGADSVLRSDGTDWVAAANPGIEIFSNGATRLESVALTFDDGTDNLSFLPNAGGLDINPSAGFNNFNLNVQRMQLGELAGSGYLFIREAAADLAGVSAYGQIWVESNAPNNLKFTDDTNQIFDVSPIEATFAATFTGFSVSPAATVRYKILGNLVFIEIDVTTALGTSNTTTFTINNVPAAIQAARRQIAFIGSAIDNGSNVAGMTVDIVGSNFFAFGLGHNNPNGGGWTASGSKGFATTDSYVFSYALG